MRSLWFALLFLVCGLAPAHAAEVPATAGDAAAGRQVFEAYCAKCHSFDPSQRGKRGPHLAGLLQRRYGSVPGFPYRMVWPPADPVWTVEQLHAYLEIHRLAEPGIRADLIAFLVTATKGAPIDVALGDAAAGETLFNAKCAYCHSLVREPGQGTAGARATGRYEEVTRAMERHPWQAPGGPPEKEMVTELTRRGPHFAGLLSRAPGAAEGFAYRFVYDIASPTWTPHDLDDYIAFHARLEPLERADLIAFLRKAAK